LLIEATFDANRGFAIAQQAMISHAALRSAVFVPPNMEFWQQAIQTDVSGYLTDEAELLHCLSEISQRRRYISPALQRLALMPSPDVLDIVRNLKPRYKQILKLLAHGLTARQIGIELKISEATVRTHKENLVTVLGLDSAAELKGFAGSVLGWLD
jgi:DNA-binding NarL/FixJ family response regulator